MPFTYLPISPPAPLPKLFELVEEIHNAFEEKMKLLNGCAAEFPPPSEYFGTGTLEGVTDNGDGTLSWPFNGVNWNVSSPCSGPKWGPGYSCGPCLANIPAAYDLCPIGDYDDQWTWLRAPITASSYDTNTSIGTITTDKLPFQNAVTAGFIPSIASLGSAEYRITKHHDSPGAGLTSRDRRPLKPNEEEFWRGNILDGWIDSSGNGQIYEQYNTVDPSPYDTDGGIRPAVNWLLDGNDKPQPLNYYAAKKPAEAMFFNASGGLMRVVVAANDANHLGFGQSIYQVAVNVSAGTFALSFACSNLSAGAINSIAPAFNASSSTIQTDLAAFNGMTGKVTVSGTGPFTISFDASLGFVNLNSGSGAIVNAPSGAMAISGAYILFAPGSKGMPGRIPDSFNAWYTGARQSYQSHDIATEPSLGSTKKPVYNVSWSNGNPCAICSDPFQHAVLFVDAQYESDNACVGSLAGDWISPDHYKNWGNLVRTAADLLPSFVDTYNPWGDFQDPVGPNMFTPATWANETGQPGAWTAMLSVANSSIGTVSTISIDITLLPISVFYSVISVHSTVKEYGVATLNADGTLGGAGFDHTTDDGLTIDLWAGPEAVHRARHLYNEGRSQWITDSPPVTDPPAITPGGFLPDPGAPTLTLGQTGNISQGITCSYRTSTLNASGETNASTGATVVTTSYSGWNSSTNTSNPILTSTYSVVLTWTPESGASTRNIFGERNGSGGELFMINVVDSLGTWTDNGSIIPSGASPPTSNTTNSDCFGTGTWIHRPQSSSLLSVTTDGFINDGNGYNIATGTLSLCIGNTKDSAFSGRGPIQASLDDAIYYDGFARMKHRKPIHLQQINQSTGSIVWSNKFSIFDPSKNFWNDGINDGSALRVQGGQFNAGGGTSATDSNFNQSSTGKACWFLESRYVGSYRTGEITTTTATPFSFFILQIYSGGMPAGWVIDETGNAIFITPAATGHAGSFANGSAPSIVSFNSSSGSQTNALLHATGFPQPVFIQGNNFNTAGMQVTLTSPDMMTVIPITLAPAAITNGELSLGTITFPRGSNGSWGAVVTDPASNLSSGSVAMPVGLMQAVPIESFAEGVFTFSATLDTPVASLDGYLIEEGRYTQNNRAGKVYTFTPPTNASSPIRVVCRYSDKHSLYFDAQTNAPTGTYSCLNCNYSAGEQYVYGGVFQLSTGKPTVASGLVWQEGPPLGSAARYWVQPTGSDPRGEKFRKQIWSNLPTKVSTYGYFQFLDDWTPSIPNQLYLMLKDMKKTAQNYSFKLSPSHSAELNSTAYGENGGPIGYGPIDCGGDPHNPVCSFSDAVSLLESWNVAVAMCADPPGCNVGLIAGGSGNVQTVTPNGEFIFIGLYRVVNDPTVGPPSDVTDSHITNDVSAAYNYGFVSGACYPYSSELDFFSFGSIDSLDTPQGTNTSSSTTTDLGCLGILTTTVGGTNGNTFHNAGNSVTYHTWQQWGSGSGNANDLSDIYSSGPLGNLATFPTYPDPTVSVGATCTDITNAESRNIGWWPYHIILVRTWSGLKYV